MPDFGTGSLHKLLAASFPDSDSIHADPCEVAHVTRNFKSIQRVTIKDLYDFIRHGYSNTLGVIL